MKENIIKKMVKIAEKDSYVLIEKSKLDELVNEIFKLQDRIKEVQKSRDSWKNKLRELKK